MREFILRIMAEVLANEFGIEAVETGGNCGMRRKDISCPRNVHGQVKRLFMVLHIAACPFEDRERRMTFIEMANLRLQTYGPQQSPAADTKHDLLFQPHLRVAAIEFAGNPAMSGSIREIVGVEQVEFRSPN